MRQQPQHDCDIPSAEETTEGGGRRKDSGTWKIDIWCREIGTTRTDQKLSIVVSQYYRFSQMTSMRRLSSVHALRGLSVWRGLAGENHHHHHHHGAVAIAAALPLFFTRLSGEWKDCNQLVIILSTGETTRTFWFLRAKKYKYIGQYGVNHQTPHRKGNRQRGNYNKISTIIRGINPTCLDRCALYIVVHHSCCHVHERWGERVV
jgi:hypothetical protein